MALFDTVLAKDAADSAPRRGSGDSAAVDSEVESTDAGGVYSAASSSDPEPPLPADEAPLAPQQLLRVGQPLLPPPPGLLLPDKACEGGAAKDGVRRNSKGPVLFCLWPLEPIPGSPSEAASGARQRLPPPPAEPAPGSPSSPKRRARAAMLAKAKRERLPLKVREPAGCPARVPRGSHWDPTLPVKKAYVPRTPKSALAAKRLIPGVPAKKRESGFLLEDTPHCDVQEGAKAPSSEVSPAEAAAAERSSMAAAMAAMATAAQAPVVLGGRPGHVATSGRARIAVGPVRPSPR